MEPTRSRTSRRVDRQEPVPDWLQYPELELGPILEASLREFQQHGYHGTTIRSIAQAAGFTMPTLYYHHGSKEGILLALLDVSLDDLELHVSGALEAGATTQAKFDNFILSVALHYTFRRDLAMLHDEYRFLGPETREQYTVRRRAVERTLENLLQQGVKEKVFAVDDARFTTRMLLGMLSGILDWYRPNGPLSPAEIAERYIKAAGKLVTKKGPGR